MPEFRVEVYREWTERGHVVVDADSEEEARERGADMLTCDDTDIEWQSSNMDPGQEAVESVTRVDE